MSQPWYHDGLHFHCTGCGDCCTGDPGYVWVNQREIQALARQLSMEVTQFQRTCVREVGTRKSLTERPNGDCVLFDSRTRRCRAYAHRPRQCRTWPFWPSNLQSPRAWETTCGVCPGCGQGRLIGAAEIEAQVRVIRV